ncbi:MAG: hypothetical protein EHM67_00020 [Hyphomicrobiaceae bacterium]|nr:MAG: hypothetical protein EHM67_00020 [Hyphomicrobiaceae bacterium]
MKMHQQDFLALEAAIKNRFSAADRVAMWSRYVARDLGAKRFRWDLLHASGFDTRGLYAAGLNDSHIDTALRRIVPINKNSY